MGSSFVENLDQRCLLANVALSADGTLNVTGTVKSDRIDIIETGSDVFITFNGAQQQFNASEIKAIVVIAGDGNDRANIGAKLPAAYVNGEAGDDLLQGGDFDDTLTGGAGKNTLFGGGGDDRLNGSGGRDALSGEAGNDRLFGNGGDDTLDGGGGRDRLIAGDGDDSMLGGSSNDKLYGQDGRDTLVGQKGADILDGGSGKDTAIFDDTDTLVSIQRSAPNIP